MTRSRRTADASGRVAQWAAVALGVSIPISVALDNVLLAVILAIWLLGGHYAAKLSAVRRNLVAAAALALFGVLAIGLTYGSRFPGDGLRYLSKYSHLLFVAVLLPCFAGKALRQRALAAYAAAILATLVISYGFYFALIPANRLLAGWPLNPVAFKFSITHNILVGFGAFLFAQQALNAASVLRRWAYVLLALLALYNVVFVVKGRTGYLVVAALVTYLCIQMAGRKGLAVAAVVLMTLFTAAYFASETFHVRVAEATRQVLHWHPGKPSDTSIGERLEFYRNSIAIIREHPVFGVGTGGFPRAYAQKVKGTGMIETANPHNEYLLITTQVGIVGLTLLLALFFVQWRFAAYLATPLERHLARGLVLTMMVGCLFNSLLLDHTEGLLYAWMSGLLFAGLKPPASDKAGAAP